MRSEKNSMINQQEIVPINYVTLTQNTTTYTDEQ